MPPNKTHMRHSEAMEIEEDVEAWGGQSVFQQLPLNDGTPAESKATKRGLREGL